MLNDDERGFLTDENGMVSARFVDSFVTAEFALPTTSVIGFRLLDSTSPQTNDVAAEDAYQFRMSATRARAFARALLDLADEIEGKGKPRQ